ncbi:MAG: tRNA pseudouridine(38-40) synthase TruA [Burkholderiales bacterium]
MRIALGIEYNGSGFCGWQTQLSGCAVQDALERALSQVAGEKIGTICAGRTDAGVHALAQVVHFDCAAARPDSAWVRGTNTSLPATAAVTWVQQVPAEFSARYAATERRYQYVLLNHAVRPALNDCRVAWMHAPLDIARMREAAASLTGEHDFSAFRSSECQAKSPVRELRRLDVRKSGDYVVFDLTANAFLHHMVRNIVGCLVYVGKGRHAPGWAGEVLASRDRGQAAPTLEAAGLYLAHVSYDAKWGLPAPARRAWFDEN